MKHSLIPLCHPAVYASLLLTGSLLSASPVAAVNPLLAGLSLPQVNNSAIGYGKSVDGAVSDKLFYTLGGGSVISQPATRGNLQKLGLNAGWSSDLMCGNFDLKTTVGNQLNGVTSGFKKLMGDVVQGASGAVASLPAMVIQRANPGLYDMLTNGVLNAGVAFDKAQLNCQNMAKRMMDFSDGSRWNQSAVLDEYRSTGFAPMLEEATKSNAEQLVRLVNGAEPPTADNLAKLKTGGLPVTAGVIKALQRDPDNAALTGRLAGELAMSDTVETALLMRRMIVTGMSEPNAAAMDAAINEGDRRIDALDREISAMKNEMELKRELSRNSVLTIIDRENQRVESNPQTEIHDNTDSRFNQMSAPSSQ